MDTYATAAAAASTLPVLVGCESTARGLHLEGVDTVFILSRPRTADEYLHLAGRTGRSGQAGKAVAIMSFSEVAALKVWSSQLKFDAAKLLEDAV